MSDIETIDRTLDARAITPPSSRKGDGNDVGDAMILSRRRGSGMLAETGDYQQIDKLSPSMTTSGRSESPIVLAKRPAYISAEEANRIKRNKQGRSCDACRARKRKCDRPPPGKLEPGMMRIDKCSQCSQLGLICEYERWGRALYLPLCPCFWYLQALTARSARRIKLTTNPGTFDYKPKKRGPPNMYVRQTA